MSRRPLILRELGLLPLWQLRRAPDRCDETPTATPDAAPPDGQPVASAPPPRLANPIAPVAPPGSTTRPRIVVPTAVALPATPPVAPAKSNDTLRQQAIATMGWAELEQSISQCQACSLGHSRTQAVAGCGDRQARWLIVGEAPGEEEDARGEPFVGQSGQLLDHMLLSLGLRRDQDVYIANVLKCRPPANRNPLQNEVQSCTPYLQRQIELIKPQVILALGRFAIDSLLGSDAPLAALRGQVHRYRDIPLVVSYHPAYLLRNLPAKAHAWRDLLLAQSVIAARADKKE